MSRFATFVQCLSNRPIKSKTQSNGYLYVENYYEEKIAFLYSLATTYISCRGRLGAFFCCFYCQNTNRRPPGRKANAEAWISTTSCRRGPCEKQLPGIIRVSEWLSCFRPAPPPSFYWSILVNRFDRADRFQQMKSERLTW